VGYRAGGDDYAHFDPLRESELKRLRQNGFFALQRSAADVLQDVIIQLAKVAQLLA
jgi:hypothetical protein